MSRFSAHPPSHHGVSLIEVLVSLVILSLGVLAVVALQLVSKRNNADAGQRTVAAQLAYDMIERMRTNSAPARLAAYRTGNSPIGRVSRGGNPPAQDCIAATCTPAQRVVMDLWEWEQGLDGAAEELADGSNVGGLNTPTGCINGPATGTGLYTVTIVWRGAVGIPDSNAGAATDATPLGCGRNLQVAGVYVYGEDSDGNGTVENNDRFRRSVSVPAFITARQP